MGEQDAVPTYTDPEQAVLEQADSDPTTLTDADVALLHRLLDHENPQACIDALNAVEDCVFGIDYEPIPGRLEPLYPTIAALLSNDEADVRSEAATALGFAAEHDIEYVPSDAARTLLTTLEQGDTASLRSTAATALGRIGAANPEYLPGDAVQALVYALDDGEWQVEKSAAFAIGQVGETAPGTLKGTEAIERLLAKHNAVNVDTAPALGRIGDTAPGRLERHDVIERLIEQTRANEYRRRRDAVDSLGDVVEQAPGLLTDAVVEAVVQTSSDDESHVRGVSARVLGQFARTVPGSIDADLLDPLVDLLADDNSTCRNWAASAIEKAIKSDPENVAAVYDPAALLEEFTTLLQDLSPEVQKSAASALGAAGDAYPEYVDASLLDALLEVESDRPTGVSARQQTHYAVGELGRAQPAAIADRHLDALLCPERGNPEPDDTSSRLSAIAMIAEGNPRHLADEQYVEQLATFLDDEGRRQAASALATVARDHPTNIVRADVTEAVEASLRQPEPPLGSAGTLGALGGGLRDWEGNAVAALKPILDHDDTATAGAAAAELLQLDSESVPVSAARDALRTAIRSGNRWTRGTALTDAATIAETHPDRIDPLVDDIVDALDSYFPTVRESACAALGALGATRACEDVRELTDDVNAAVRTAAADAVDALSGGEPSSADATVSGSGTDATDESTGANRTSPTVDTNTASADGMQIPDVNTDATATSLDLDPQSDLLAPEPVETHGGAAADVRIMDIDGKRDVDRVAVKLPRTAGTVTADLMERFVQEAQNWDQLADHPHVVSLYDWGTEPVPWLALEYMDGGTLASRLDTFDVPQAVWTAAVIARAVWHGHRHATHHRDLKPQNVLLHEMSEGTWDIPKVADWGSARHHADRTSPSAGYTPEYAAPEQIQPEEYETLDERTDVFQLGVVCYELCTGEHPFDADGPPAAVMMSILTDEPTPPSEVRESLPGELDDILLHALETTPTNRYETVLDFARDLEDVFATIQDDTRKASDAAADSATTDASDKGDGYRPGDIQRHYQNSDRDLDPLASSLATIERKDDVEPASVSKREFLRTGWQILDRLATLEPWERAIVIDVTTANDDVSTRYGLRVLREIDIETWQSWITTADRSSSRWSDLFQSGDEIESMANLEQYLLEVDRELAELESLAVTERRRSDARLFGRLCERIELERKHLSFMKEYAAEHR